MDYIDDLHELCDTISNAIRMVNEKVRSSGGQLSSADIEYVDKLTHSLKSIKTTVAMMENSYDDGSYRDGSYRGGSYQDGSSRDGSYRDGSYNSYRRRDSMGRYSRYSRDGEMERLADEIRGMMANMPEGVKTDAQRLLSKIEQN